MPCTVDCIDNDTWGGSDGVDGGVGGCGGDDDDNDNNDRDRERDGNGSNGDARPVIAPIVEVMVYVLVMVSLKTIGAFSGGGRAENRLPDLHAVFVNAVGSFRW